MSNEGVSYKLMKEKASSVLQERMHCTILEEDSIDNNADGAGDVNASVEMDVRRNKMTKTADAHIMIVATNVDRLL
jgi:hypothetical protein